MINFKQSIRAAYTKYFVGRSPSHAEKVLICVAFLADGIIGQSIQPSALKKAWSRNLFKVVYHDKYLVDCEVMGWIDRSQRGSISLTDEGLSHLTVLLATDEQDPLADSAELLVFPAKRAHDFDKLIRAALASATKSVKIADSYVDESIFDTLLSEIPSGIRIDLMYNNGGSGTFHSRARRFKIQYPDFHIGHYPKLHDRFMIVDDIGFIIGPSLKDATINAPAIVVRIDKKQTVKLTSLFDNIYANITKNF